MCRFVCVGGEQVGQENAIATYEVIIENLCWAGGRNSDGVCVLVLLIVIDFL